MSINKSISKSKRGLVPISRADAQILLLGSMPGEKSLASQEYYAHPRNAFWRIMQPITKVTAEATYAERTKGLQSAGIALWDVVESCQRQGSLDANIKPDSITINTFKIFFAAHPKLRWIGLNGSKAYTLFYQHIIKADLLPAGVAYDSLPSTSPAYTIPVREKMTCWHDHLTLYLDNSLPL